MIDSLLTRKEGLTHDQFVKHRVEIDEKVVMPSP